MCPFVRLIKPHDGLEGSDTYSLELAPSDFHLFGPLKESLKRWNLI